MYKDANYFTLVKRDNGAWSYYCYCPMTGKRLLRATNKYKKGEAMAVIQDRISRNCLHYPTGHKPVAYEPVKSNAAIRDVPLAVCAADFYIEGKCPIMENLKNRGGKFSNARRRSSRSTLENLIMPFFGNMKPKDVTTPLILNWLCWMRDERKLSPSTANSKLVVIREVFQYLLSVGIVDKDPTKGASRLIEQKVRRDAFTLQEIHQLFDNDPEWMQHPSYWACRLASVTGMRVGEVLALTKETFLPDRIDVIYSFSPTEGLKSTKSSWQRVIPISEDIYRMVMEGTANQGQYIFSLDGGRTPMSSTCVRLWLDTAMERNLSISKKEREERKLCFHSFRHFFNTRLVASGLSGDKIRAVIGHETASMTEHYTHLQVEDMSFVKDFQKDIFSSK